MVVDAAGPAAFPDAVEAIASTRSPLSGIRATQVLRVNVCA